MLHTVIFIGRSGCGKGTQATLFMNRIHTHDSKKRQILYVETGERFRHFIRGESFSSKVSSDIYKKDLRQPDFLACFMWASLMIEELDDNMHLVFDGAPRSEPEAALVTTAIEFYKRQKPTVVYINVSRKWSEERLLARGRTDDKTLSKINKRLNWFDEDVVPAIKYFKNNSLYRFLEINGEQSIEKVQADLIAEYDYK
jgi:adenylate kinase